jgi:hypothetical protein
MGHTGKSRLVFYHDAQGFLQTSQVDTLEPAQVNSVNRYIVRAPVLNFHEHLNFHEPANHAARFVMLA